VRTPRLEALTRTPGAILKEKPDSHGQMLWTKAPSDLFARELGSSSCCSSRETAKCGALGTLGDGSSDDWFIGPRMSRGN
jgi:hypothetical protein